MPRILIVDDEPDIRDCLQSFFTARGFSVAYAFSGEEAIDQLTSQVADVILLDINLPGLSGLEVLKRVKDLSPSCRVVMLSAFDEPYLRSQAAAYGAYGYITKPFNFSEATWAPVLSHPF